MANARNPSLSFFLLLLFFLIIILLLPKAVAITEAELDAATAALRSRSYHLFGNAITAFGVHLDLLQPVNSSFTLLAPPDALLFSLDMAAPSAAAYVAALRLHVVPGRLSFSDLRSLPGDCFPLETLLPGREILVSRRRSPDADFLTVDGVDVVLPGIFYGRDLAVHGLGGIISLQPPARPPPSRPAYQPSISPESSMPPSNAQISELSPSRSADPPVLGTPMGSPATSPMISPESSFPPSDSAYPPALGSPTPSSVVSAPSISPAEEAAADAVGFPWQDWACANDEAGGCTGTGWGWLGRSIGGWPRREVRDDGAL